MTQVFILQNQDKLFLSKKSEWVDGRDLGCLYKTPHKDVAANQIFEASSKDYHQRIQMLACPTNPKGLPEIDPDIMPAPLPKPDTSGQLELVDAQQQGENDSSTAPDTPDLAQPQNTTVEPATNPA